MESTHKNSSNRTQKPVINTEGLVDERLIPPEAASDMQRVEENFRIRIPTHALEQIDALNAADPIYAQYVPDLAELTHRDDELPDPIGDGAFEKQKGITHRYPDRLLLKPTHACQVYCRFCFRREKVGQPEAALNTQELKEAIDYIREHDSIWEVILSGGDPLVLSDRRIGDLLAEIATIDHVAVIRFHTRVPLVSPERITPALIDALKRARKAVNFVIHVNHPRELTEQVKNGLAKLVDNGIPLYSQTVLLSGINDDAAILADLFKTLVANRAKPYYLHHLDKAQGVSHFRVDISRGQAIMRELRGRVSGLCQPTYVLDIPGGYGKVPIGPVYLQEHDDGDYSVSDYLGGMHNYAETR